MLDARRNLAISSVATAPSPATTGLTLDVAAGTGSRFPATPFSATVFPSGSIPDPANAEIVRVTGRASDTLTIVRARESSTARAIAVGDLIVAGPTVKTFDDLVANDYPAPADFGLLGWSVIPHLIGSSTFNNLSGRQYFTRVGLPSGPVTNLHLAIRTAGSGLVAGQSLMCLLDPAGTRVGVSGDLSTAFASTGLKTAALSGGPVDVDAGDYYVGVLCQATTTQPAYSASAYDTNSGIMPGLGTTSTRAGLADTTNRTAFLSSYNLATLGGSQVPWAAVS